MRVGIVAFALLLCMPLHASMASDTFNPVGGISLSAPQDQRLTKWLEKTSSEIHHLRWSRNAKVRKWYETMQALPARNPQALFLSVNTLNNAMIPYKAESAGKDEWQTPFETITQGGDCEDIALLKATALVMKGWPKAKISLVLGRLERAGGKKQDHAVLGVLGLDQKVVLLNNTQPASMVLDMLPATKVQKNIATAAGAVAE